MANSKENKDLIIFDAVRDNKGKGIKISHLIKILKKLNQRDK